MKELPLEGIKILDASRVLAGPFCTTILADLGASVIKIEDDQIGDETRHYEPLINGISTYFISINHNKTYVRLNLKSENDREELYTLIRESDVFLHNFTPQTEEKLGVTFDKLVKFNESLIYVSISGYGRDGPKAGFPAYDIVIQGESGLMSVTGCDKRNLARVGNSTTDIYAGYQCAISVLSYLFVNKTKTKKAVNIDISLLDSTLYSMTYLIPYFSAKNESPKALGISHPGIVPYQSFSTSDEDIIIAVANEKQWSKFSKIFGFDTIDYNELFGSNENRVKNRDLLTKLIQDRIREKSSEEVLNLLTANGIPAGKINSIEEMINDPQVKYRKSLKSIDINGRKIYLASFPAIVNGKRLD